MGKLDIIVRILEVIFTCISFSLVASVGHSTDSFWTCCMFTWCFCFSLTLCRLCMEFPSLRETLPDFCNDFAAACAMLSTLMVLAASIIYPIFFTCPSCGRQIGATVTSCLAFILHAIEVCLMKAEKNSRFLYTVPGFLKILETFVACIIFFCLDYTSISRFPGLQWCVAVYSICSIFTFLVIISTICQLLSACPEAVGQNKVLTVCNALAVLMYITAVVIWPLYSFKNNPRPSYCSKVVTCPWNNLVVISFMTCVNLIAYIVDTVYSFRLVFS
ncbi:myeloid-associated differentiation marker homolog [Seriola dumerili]|nr:myeloid-associated differentiation marker homolog [Seriola dumerili]